LSVSTHQDRGPRFLFYSHDSFGLGHLRRTLALAGALADRDGGATSLIMTGLTVASAYRLPPRVDTLKLPALRKDDTGSYRALRLDVDFDDLQRVRSSLALATAQSFAPAVTIVDKTPLGLRGELIPALDWLSQRAGGRLVLGLRDIDDSPSRVRREWRRNKLREAIQRYYDAVVVYGPAASMDALRCLQITDLGVPVHHVGYVGPAIPGGAPPDFPPEYVLVTAGGGGDGFEVLATFVQAVRSAPLPLPAVIVAGPLMSDDEFQRLARLTDGLNVRLHEFRADMESVIAGARAVVAMAGYNTVSELLAARKPALLVPRVRPREEQLVRARMLADRGLADMLHPDELDPARMRAAIEQLLDRDPPDVPAIEQGGAHRAAQILLELAARHRPPSQELAASTASNARRTGSLADDSRKASLRARTSAA
jgi:predicted glycosyltransferase